MHLPSSRILAPRARGVRAPSALAVALLASGVGAAGVAWADERTSAIGGEGGGAFEEACGPGAVLAGLQLRSGAALDAVGARCVQVDGAGAWSGEPYLQGVSHGGAGGGERILDCPRDQAITGLDGSLGAGAFDYVAGFVQPRCRASTSPADVTGAATPLAGAGIARADRRAIDCPDGKAATGLFGRAGWYVDGYGLVCATADDGGGDGPGVVGRWAGIADWPMIPIHAVLTPQGDVLSYGTDETGQQGAQFFYDVWSPGLGTGAASHETIENALQVDSFCSAPLVVPATGDVLMAGGDARFGEGRNKGIVDAPVFETGSRRLSRASDMGFARWYPTATTLPSGEILLAGGIDGAGVPSITPEIYSPADDRWRSLFGASSETVFGAQESRWWYPRQWVAPDGRIFGMTSSRMYYLDASGDGSIELAGTVPRTSRGYQSTAVMYAPGRILQAGGTGRDGAILVDIDGDAPTVREAARMKFDRRSWSSSTVLPDGTVLVSGGSAADNALEGAVLTPELWDPATDRWTSLADAQLPRLYHSVSLLLPDGRVMVGGGGAPGPLTNLNVELFSPPYLFDDAGGESERLRIFDAPATATHGGTLGVSHSTGRPVARATLVKTGAVTHSFDMDQRFIELAFDAVEGRTEVRLPGSTAVAPPGHYMLFLIDDRGTPGVAHVFNLG